MHNRVLVLSQVLVADALRKKLTVPSEFALQLLLLVVQLTETKFVCGP
jgi:hypothetical protein